MEGCACQMLQARLVFLLRLHDHQQRDVHG